MFPYLVCSFSNAEYQTLDFDCTLQIFYYPSTTPAENRH